MNPVVSKDHVVVLLIIVGAVIGGLGLHYVGGAMMVFGGFLALLDNFPGLGDPD